MSTQVHRFHDLVAIYAGNGETVYLTPEQAWDLGKALCDNANDVVARKFTDSTLPTFHGETASPSQIRQKIER